METFTRIPRDLWTNFPEMVVFDNNQEPDHCHPMPPVAMPEGGEPGSVEVVGRNLPSGFHFVYWEGNFKKGEFNDVVARAKIDGQLKLGRLSLTFDENGVPTEAQFTAEDVSATTINDWSKSTMSCGLLS